MNNAVFGKTMENVRNRMDYELVNSTERLKKLVNDPCFEGRNIINENLVGVSHKRKSITLDKPLIVGVSILELSKLHMYDFHYNVMKKKYGDKIKLLMTDTDSLVYEIETDDVYEDLKEYSHLLDTSELPKENQLFSTVNKKVIGKFKDETNGTPIQKFVGLRSKMYSIKVGGKEVKKAKGVKKAVVKKEVSFKDYKKSLFGTIKEDIQQQTSFNSIRSYNHQLYSITVNKIGICLAEDKRFIREDSVSTFAYGHYKINQD